MYSAECRQQKLIYIAGAGHSGSTLLEMLLGAHSQLMASGEIEMWPYQMGHGSDTLCGCGERIDECSFWTAVQLKADPLQQLEPQIQFFRFPSGAGSTLRKGLLHQFGGRNLPEDERKQITTYARNSYDVFTAVVEVASQQTGHARPQYVIDNSKNPYRLLWLLRSSLFNVTVLHITKDPRGLAYSAIKQDLQGQKRGARNHFALFLRTVRISLSWIVQNRLISQAVKHHLGEGQYLRIQYEQLAGNPESTLQSICQTIGCRFEPEVITDFYGGHAISGNLGTRFRQTGILLDNSWKKSLPSLYQRTSYFVTMPFRAHYGY